MGGVEGLGFRVGAWGLRLRVGVREFRVWGSGFWAWVGAQGLWGFHESLLSLNPKLLNPKP